MRFVTRAGLIVLALIHLEVVITMAEVAYDRMHFLYYGRFGFVAEAVYQIPGTYEEIVLERRAAHLFLAESTGSLFSESETVSLSARQPPATAEVIAK